MPPLDLTTLARMKDRDPGLRSVIASSQDETNITRTISAVSGAVADYLRRVILTGAQVEDFNVTPGVQTFLLAAYPVSASPAPSIANDTDRVFATALSTSFYYVDRSKGILYVDKTQLWPGPGVLRVTYTGGMAATTAAFVAEYPTLADVVESEVSRVLRLRGPHIDMQSEAGGGGSVSRFDAGDFSKWARQRMAPYVRELNV